MATWNRNGGKWAAPVLRLAIYLRDGLACLWCGASVEDGAKLSLDHFHAVAKTGKPDNSPGNLFTSCSRCNSSRGKRSVAAFARAVAGYVNHGVTEKDIVKSINAARKRSLPRAEAREMIKRRGTVAQILATLRLEN